MIQTALDAARRYVGRVREIPGGSHHPLIQWWLSLVGQPLHAPDEVPWCSAFVAGICDSLDLPRSGSAAARPWLTVGDPIPLEMAMPGFDVVIFQRGTGPQPGPEVLHAPGHVAFLAGKIVGTHVDVVGGNQSDGVTQARFPVSDILGVRRLWTPPASGSGLMPVTPATSVSATAPATMGEALAAAADLPPWPTPAETLAPDGMPYNRLSEVMAELTRHVRRGGTWTSFPAGYRAMMGEDFPGYLIRAWQQRLAVGGGLRAWERKYGNPYQHLERWLEWWITDPSGARP